MPTGYIPILQIKTKDGKWLPVNAIGGQVASKVLYNNAYPTVEQALDYLFENGTGGGGTGGASTAANVSYTNAALPNVKTVKTALDELVPDSHNHNNKNILDKLSVSNGNLTYDGKEIGGGGAGDFIIKMTLAIDDDGNYTVASCDATVEQIDAAVAAEKRVVVIASDSGVIIELPMLQGAEGDTYYFGTFVNGSVIISSVQKIYGGTDEWQISVAQIGAEYVGYSNTALPSVANVGDALNVLILNSHSHENKGTLDKLSDLNGKLQYNGSDISITKNGVIAALGYTPEAVSTQVTTGSNITLADNTEYRLTDVTTLRLSYPVGDFECWMRLSFAASGDATVILPTGTQYIGTTPDFKNGETWEMSIKDGVVIAQKVGDGT